MRLTLLGIVVSLGFAALLVYAGYAFHRTTQAKAEQLLQTPDSPLNP
jgi:hypothetical protein